MDIRVVSRREFLGQASTVAAVVAAGGTSGCRSTPATAPTLSSDAMVALTATAAVEAMRRGDITAEAYATALLNRVDRLQHLNAFRVLSREAVLATARNADKARASGTTLWLLHGLPLPVKDSVNTTAYPTSNGARALEGFRPRSDAAILGPLLAHGAYVMGKTNLHELSLGFTSNNPHFGAVRNPYNPEHVPGGSSGGSAVAVAARMAPIAIAEDTGGSIRVPASWCGLAGLRPTYGRYPDAGIMPLTEDKFDQVGAVARTVDDLILFDTAITGDTAPVAAATLKGLRIGIPNQLMVDLDPEVERVTATVIERLTSEGVTIVRLDMPEVLQAAQVTFGIILFEWVPAVTRFLASEGTGVSFEQLMAVSGAEIKAMPLQLPRAAYEGALKARAAIQQQVRSRFSEHGLAALAYPTTFEPAAKIGDTADVVWHGAQISRVEAIGRSTCLAPCCAQPGLVVPAGLSASGLPIGLEFDAPPGTDRQLLALGLALERVLGPIPPPAV